MALNVRKRVQSGDRPECTFKKRARKKRRSETETQEQFNYRSAINA
jgi:hypothetical protein